MRLRRALDLLNLVFIREKDLTSLVTQGRNRVKWESSLEDRSNLVRIRGTDWKGSEVTSGLTDVGVPVEREMS